MERTVQVNPREMFRGMTDKYSRFDADVCTAPTSPSSSLPLCPLLRAVLPLPFCPSLAARSPLIMPWGTRCLPWCMVAHLLLRRRAPRGSRPTTPRALS